MKMLKNKEVASRYPGRLWYRQSHLIALRKGRCKSSDIDISKKGAMKRFRNKIKFGRSHVCESGYSKADDNKSLP